MPLAKLKSASKKLASGADDVAKQPLSSSALGLGVVGIGASYAAGSMQEETASRETPAPGISNPITDVRELTETTARNAALTMAGVETPGTGFATGTFAASGVAGVGTGAYQYMAEGTMGSRFRQQFEGKNVFNTQKKGTLHRLFGKGTSSATKKAGNALYRGMGGLGAVAAGTFAAAATTSIIDRTTERLAQKVMETGTPGSRLSQNNVLGNQGPRTKRSQPTDSGVSRYAGRMQNVMDGSTVLALHKTGGRGAVLGG